MAVTIGNLARRRASSAAFFLQNTSTRESEGKKNAEFLRPLTRGRSVGRSYLYISRQNSQLFKNAFAAAFHGKERNSHV